MEQLPDDVLVQVMQHLSVDDVLACRLVCRRFEGPSLFREVWHRRRLVDDQRPCVCAALRLAPSLEAVLCSGHASALAATQCAVAELILVLEKDINPAKYAQVVHNQEALGRLKRVEVRYALGAHFSDRAAPSPLSVALVESSCLESLVFPKYVPYAPSPIPHRPARSSLKIFKCGLNEVNEHFVEAVLAGHASTLEEVDLGGGFSFALGTANLLASMPKLERLKCDILRDLEAVAACKTLKDMTLCIDPVIYNYFPTDGAAKFLRLANQLHTLSVEFGDFTFPEEIDTDSLLDALASSGGSLERLSVIALPLLQQLQPLIGVLPQLPALRLLSISADWELMEAEELLGITSATAPALRRLELLEDVPHNHYHCLHDWLHDGTAVNAVRILDANPSLHVHLPKPFACKYMSHCDACAQGCHRQAEWNGGGRLVLFAHDPDDCPSPEDHTADSTWTCLHIRCTPD